MNNQKSCPSCRNFNSGHCRLNPPPYPPVSEADWCSRFSIAGVARGAPSKISDEMIMKVVEDNWTEVVLEGGKVLPPVATRRGDLVSDMMEHGVSQTPVLKRIERLVAQGRLMTGDDPMGKKPGICVWPAPAEREEVQRPGRPAAIGQDELQGIISELAPERESAVSLRAVHRALGGRISLGALHAAVKELVAAGRVLQDEKGIYSAALDTTVPDTPGTST